MSLTSRTAVIVLAAAACVVGGTRVLPDAWSVTWIASIAGLSVLAAVAPGAFVFLAWRPRDQVPLLEWLGFSIGISFALVHLLTIAALTAHWPPTVTIAVLALIVIGHAAVLVRRGWRRVPVRVDRSDLVFILVLSAIAVFLYSAGSPFELQEDRIHISIVQRLAHLRSPTISNIYLSPDVVYTYPFPGTHYMLALMSRLGDVEPMFLYHKLRAFWGVAALVLLYGCARAVFESAQIALMCALAVAALVINGTLTAVPDMYWGQMTPYSHASDLAMGILLPALLQLSFTFLAAKEPRESRFFLVGSMAMVVMLVMVHPREIVQFLVYLVAFSPIVLVARGPRTIAIRTAVLLVLSTCAVVAYGLWYRESVSAVDSLVREQRAELVNIWLLDIFRDNPWAALGYPLPLLGDYMPAFEPIFRGWNSLALLAGAFVLYVLRHRALAWLFASSITAYVLIIRLPVLAIPYIYATYFEILYTPVRNVVFFVYVMTGMCFAVIAAWLARLSVVRMCLGITLVWLAVPTAFKRVGPVVVEHPDLLFISLVVAYAGLLVAIVANGSARGRPVWLEPPLRRWAVVLAALLLPIAAATRAEGSMLTSAWWSNPWPTPAALLAGLECRDEGQFCPPPPELVRFIRARVPADAILATDYREAYEPTLFFPQQVVVWSGATGGLANIEKIFPVYLRHLKRAQAASLEQPLFDDRETREDRLAFIRDLRVTYVLVNPRLYPRVKDVFARDSDVFALRYDHGNWALYQVIL